MLFAARLCLASFLVLFLPGYLINFLIIRNEKLNLLEALPLAFGVSVAYLTALMLLSFVLHFSISTAVLILSFTLLLLAYLAFRRMRESGSLPFGALSLTSGREELILAIPALVVLVGTMVLGYRIEMPTILGQEDKITLMMAQKIRSLPSMHIDQTLFKQGDIIVYLLPLYAFFLALIGVIGQLEIVQVYVKLRFVLSLISIATAFAIARNLFPRARFLPWITLLLVLSSVWSGWGTNFSSSVTLAQFFPYSQYYDLAICVVLPVCILLFLRGLQSWAFCICCMITTTSLLFIHARETIVLLILYASGIAGLLLGKGHREQLTRGALVILGTLVMVLLWRLIQSWIVDPKIFMWEEYMNAETRAAAADLISKGSFKKLFYPPLEETFIISWAFNLFYENPYFLMSVFLIPLLFLMRQASPYAMLLACCVLSPVVISAVPILRLLFLKSTYSQFMFGAPVIFGMIPLSYVIIAFWMDAAMEQVARPVSSMTSRRAAYLSVAAVSLIGFIAAPLILHSAQWVYFWSRGAFYIWLAGGSVLFFAFSYIPRTGLVDLHLSARPELRFCLLSPLFLMIFISLSLDHGLWLGRKLLPVFEVRPTSAKMAPLSFYEHYKVAKASPSVVDWEAWYKKSTLSTVPWASVKWIREHIPTGRVFAAPISAGSGYTSALYNIPALTGQFVYTSGSFLSMLETDFFDRLYKMKFKESPYGLFENDDRARIEYLTKARPGLLNAPKKAQVVGALIYFLDDFMREHQPVFNNHDPAEVKLQMIGEFGIDYLLLTPDWNPTNRAAALFLDRFETVFSNDSARILKTH